ncbi:hypothetical protein ZEAMMB73_Zm00001d007041 [Zea mays]|uniref:Uncharacterized protein n=1 Tax=Zea mays TaxID=4577 RepID=A0A1D6F2G2_MAIZE|nr:hypothetical protein ZEAMMB73_Zm00001d007041 [Zea mays]
MLFSVGKGNICFGFCCMLTCTIMIQHYLVHVILCSLQQNCT